MEISDEVRQWRKAQRAQLLARRNAVAPADRRRWNAAIGRLVVEQFPVLQGMLLGSYCPLNGEFDPRAVTRLLRKCGTRVALPAVAQRHKPLQYREWWPGAPMVKDAAGIAVPDSTEVVRPDALLMPPVGFDSRGYRLGYGGGYFDRTLAAMSPQPLKIGVAFELSRIATIQPLSHDVPMDFIVTEAGVHQVAETGLELLTEPNRAFGIACEIIWRRDRTAREEEDAIEQRREASGKEGREYASPVCYAHELDPFYKDA
jgi:5,10-methenyltetrahydrofolate synthetase